MIFTLDFASDIPIYQQIRNEIVTGISKGEFEEGERLPTIRALANEIGVNVMTVNKAYELLKQEGYIQADRRRGAVVLPSREKGIISKKQKKQLQLLLCELRLQGVSKKEILSLCSELYEEE